VYQRTDKYEEYNERTRKYCLAAHNWLLEHADLVLYVSTALYEQEGHLNPHSVLVKHGVDLDLFDAQTAMRAGRPHDLAGISRPIAGFFGEVSDDTVDMACIGAVARALPEVSFVFVGRFIADPSPVRSLRNVHFLGMKPYAEVARYGSQFDLAIMPWQRSSWIHYCNPIKLKEYLALGLPVVSTDFPEVFLYQDTIFIARNDEEFIHGIREALAGRGTGTAESRRARVADDTWDEVAACIIDRIYKVPSCA